MSAIPDLTPSEWWHNPELAYSTSVPERFDAVMVGWLGAAVPTTGTVSGEIVSRLRWACDHLTIDQGWLGEHECQICENFSGRGEVLVAGCGDKMYVAPRMILHYIEVHAYCPPQEFLDAVVRIETTTDIQPVPPGFHVCRQCGGPMRRASPPDTSPVIMECRRCHHREYAEILVPAPWSPVEQGAYRVIVHRNQGPAAAQEVKAFRKLSRELRSLPIDAVAEYIGSNRIVDLGVHSEEDARGLVKQAIKLGLEARLIGPEGSVTDQDDRLYEPFGAPVSVGEPGEETRVIPFGWLVIGVLLVAAVVWFLW